MGPPGLSLGGAFNVSQSPRVRRRTQPERDLGYARFVFPPDFIDFHSYVWENPPQWRGDAVLRTLGASSLVTTMAGKMQPLQQFRSKMRCKGRIFSQGSA
jgi:hypothetical protein